MINLIKMFNYDFKMILKNNRKPIKVMRWFILDNFIFLINFIELVCLNK